LAQESALKTEGDYTFYVKVKDAAGNESPCSENSVTYTLDLTLPPAPTGLLLGESVSSIDIMKRPLIKVEGVSSGQTVSLYKEKTCSSRFAKKESLGEVVEFRQGDFSWSLAPGDYKIYAKTVSFAGNASSCSSAKLDYTRLALPNELSTSDDPLEFSLWLDPSLSLNSNIETVSGGTEVEVLNDMSGKENSFQTLGPRLFYKTNGAGIGGKNTLYSDQTDFRRLSSNKENFKFLHDNSTSYTIGIFVRSDCTKAYCALFGNNSGTRRKRGIGLGIDERSPNKGQLWFSISDGSDFNLQLKTPNNSITKGKGSFIIVEFKGSEAAVYVNNTLKKVQKAFSGRPYSNKEASYDIHLGGHPKRILSNGVCQNCSLSQFKAWSFKGHIGDVLIYKNILTPSQKLELYDYMSRKWDIRK
jgi:hypothetical protein